MDSTSERIARLADELATRAAALAAAGSAIRAVSSEGADPRKAVSVVLDGSGRVTRVRPSALWAQRITPGELGDAVFAAVQAAEAARIAEYVAAVQRSHETDAAAAATAPPRGTAAPDEARPLSNLPAVLDEIATAIAGLDRLIEQPPVQPGEHTRTTAENVRSHRPVQVILSRSGEHSAVRIDPQWAQRANLQQLTTELGGAFERAYQEFDTSADARAPSASELPPRMAAIAADPLGALHRHVDELRASRHVGR